MDYEAELGVVIGRRARQVPVENALEVVAGYICVNDVTRARPPASETASGRAASRSTRSARSGPPRARAEVADPQALGIRAILNGEVMQESTTANMIFGVAEIIAFVSEAITLEPGDLILTGTPAGVGVFRDRPYCFSQATRSPSRSTASAC